VVGFLRVHAEEEVKVRDEYKQYANGTVARV
jgi:hypothetical protein